VLSIFAFPPRDAEAARRRRRRRELKTLWAVVRSDGTLVSNKGVTAAGRTPSAVGRPSGDYLVNSCET
jgi:hypothetical protein